MKTPPMAVSSLMPSHLIAETIQTIRIKRGIRNAKITALRPIVSDAQIITFSPFLYKLGVGV